MNSINNNTCLVALWLSMLMLFCSVGVNAQTKGQLDSIGKNTNTRVIERMMRPYEFTDNIFYGFNAAGGFSLSEYVKEYGYLKSIRPDAGFYVGKYFSPWIGARAELGYHWQKCSVDPLVVDQPDYDVHFISTFLDGMLCLNRLFMPRYNPNERFQFVGILGIGALYNFPLSSKVKEWSNELFISAKGHFSWAARAGGQIQWRMSSKTNLNVYSLWYTAASQYNGLTNNSRPRHFLEFGLGVSVRLPNHYGSQRFEYCRGNEIYYFRQSEDQLLKDHAKQFKKYRKGKADEPQRAAELDSVLIFPEGYPYLTKRQEAKLNSVIAYLLENTDHVATFDLYPIVSEDPKMTPVQSVDRVASVISGLILKRHKEIQSHQVVFNRNYYKSSPYASEGIWIHGAVVHKGIRNTVVKKRRK